MLRGYATLREQYGFDIEGLRSSAVGDCGDLVGDTSDPGGTGERIQGAIGRLLEAGVVPVVHGGDDSVPIPMFQGFAGRGPLTVVQVDAHLDWRDEVRGERFGYSSPMRRASEMGWVEGVVPGGLRGVGRARAARGRRAGGWGGAMRTGAGVDP